MMSPYRAWLLASALLVLILPAATTVAQAEDSSEEPKDEVAQPTVADEEPTEEVVEEVVEETPAESTDGSDAPKPPPKRKPPAPAGRKTPPPTPAPAISDYGFESSGGAASSGYEFGGKYSPVTYGDGVATGFDLGGRATGSPNVTYETLAPAFETSEKTSPGHAKPAPVSTPPPHSAPSKR